MDVIERVARVLAGMRYSRIAEDAGSSGVADADLVDLNCWILGMMRSRC